MNTTLKYNLPNNIVMESAYSASKLSNKFNIKWKIKQDHQHVTYVLKKPVGKITLARQQEDCLKM